MNPTECPAREKKNEVRKAKKRGGENAKSKSEEIFLSAYAQTLQANIWHLD